MNYDVLGRRIEKLIHEQLHITQREFARTIEIDEHNLSHVIAGRKGLQVKTIVKICECYGVSADWLLGLD